MKIRSGFVSNSSSSSFILGIGRVVDLAKFMEFQKTHPELSVRMLSEIILDRRGWYDPKVNWVRNTLELDCDYSGGSVSVDFNMEKDLNQHFCFVEIHNNEGDWEGSVLCDAVYEGGSISEDYFDDDQQAYLHLGEEQGVADYDSTFGCGRNG